MIKAEYVQILERLGIWGVKVRGSIHPSDVVEVARPNGKYHYHTIQEIARDRGDTRYCTVVPVTRERLKEVYGG
jgi:hypothetical protein